MTYDICITRAAEKDLRSTADYIEYVLLNPQAADALLDDVEAAIGELSSFPEKHALVDDAVLKSWGIRFVTVGNYIAFYTVSEAEHKVYVIRFLYGKRNWVNVLKQGFPSRPVR